MNIASILETILFVYGNPITLIDLARTAGISESEASAALRSMAQSYKDRGLALIQSYDTYQLGSNPQNTCYIESLVKADFSEDLSRSSLETIAIVAYKGPISRAEVDYIRGVHSAYALRNLLMRGLVVRQECPGNAQTHLYSVSGDFLKHLGLTSMEDLPAYEELKAQAREAVEQGAP